jgi:hypothetical protein
MCLSFMQNSGWCSSSAFGSHRPVRAVPVCSAQVVDRLSKTGRPRHTMSVMKSQHQISERLAERLEDLNGYPPEDRDERYEWVRGYAEALEWVLLGEGEGIAIG